VAIKILDKEKIKQEDLGESIKKEISFENSIRSLLWAQKTFVPNLFFLNLFLRYHDENDQTQKYSEAEGGSGK
jgi:hypothetical protein